MSGTFTAMNKKRPGAYINFKSAAKASMGVGLRGIVTLPMSLGWTLEGDLIEVYATDITDGSCLKKLGYAGNAAELQPLREALKNAFTALVCRVNKGGIKATATLGELTAVAKYSGSVGNRLSVIIKKNESKFDVITCLDNNVVDKQTVATATDLTANDYVTFTGEGALAENAGVTLTSGTDGTVTTEAYSEYFEKVKRKSWNTMAFINYTEDASTNDLAIAYIKQLRDSGKKVQAVIKDGFSADNEGIISVSQGYRTSTEEVPVTSFIAYAAGLTAGAAINKSNTYSVVPGATEIINAKTDQEIEKGIDNGEFMLSYRQDGSVVVETDINSFHSFSKYKSRDFSKNRVIRVLDEVNNTVQTTFENSYIGKVDNNEAGQTSFKADLVSYCMKLQEMNAIQDFTADDVVVSAGDEIDSVIVTIGIKAVDAMEKLYMTVTVG